MNTLIREVAEAGLAMTFYSYINTAASVIAILFSLWHGKKLGIPFWKMLIILFVIERCMGVTQGFIHTVLNAIKESNIFGIETAVNSIVRLFLFLPLFAIPVAWILRLKWSHVCDAIALFPLGTSALGQLACIFPGCCRGYEVSCGIYNIKTGLYHFPVQILETILTLAIFVYLVYMLKRKAYSSDGLLYPRMIILYGIMRFICEALRDNEKIFLGCSAVAIHALAMFVIGSVILYLETRPKPIPQETEQNSDEEPASEAEPGITVTN